MLWQGFVHIFMQIKVMESLNTFWQVFIVVFIFIIWAGSTLSIKPFVTLWRFVKWFLMIIFAVLFANYAKKEVKEWWNK